MSKEHAEIEAEAKQLKVELQQSLTKKTKLKAKSIHSDGLRSNEREQLGRIAAGDPNELHFVASCKEALLVLLRNLPEQSPLQSIKAVHIVADEECARALLHASVRLPALQTLTLDSNEITSSDFRLIVDAVAQMRALRTISVQSGLFFAAFFHFSQSRLRRSTTCRHSKSLFRYCLILFFNFTMSLIIFQSISIGDFGAQRTGKSRFRIWRR